MNSPNLIQLIRLRRAVELQRQAREALDDLQDVMSSGGFNEAMRELLEEEIADLECRDTGIDINMQDLVSLHALLASVAP